MASFKDSFSARDRWALAYYVLSLSAYRDPQTGEKLEFPKSLRQALNDPGLKAETSETAYRPDDETRETALYGGEAWAEKHGFDVTGSLQIEAIGR